VYPRRSTCTTGFRDSTHIDALLPSSHGIRTGRVDQQVDSEEIAVSTKDGVVTLRGTVGSFRQRREAQRAAERLWGVKEVDSELEVRILTEHRRDDAEFVAGNIVGNSDVYNEIQLFRPTPEADDVQHAIKNAFTRDAKLDADSLVVSTRDGTVSLSSTVHSWSRA
jgi:osmotically-inducible protein OsmY